MGFALNEFNGFFGSYSYFVKVSTSHQSETILYKTIIFRLQAVLQSTVFIKNATKKGKANGVLSEGLSEASGGNDDASPGASPANEALTWGNQQELTAMASVDPKLTQMKVDICNTLQGEIAVQKKTWPTPL